MPWHDRWAWMRGEPVGITTLQLVRAIRARVGNVNDWRMRKVLRHATRPRKCRGRHVYSDADINSAVAYAVANGWNQEAEHGMADERVAR